MHHADRPETPVTRADDIFGLRRSGPWAVPDEAAVIGDDDLHTVTDLEFGGDVGDVSLDGALAEVEPRGDFGASVVKASPTSRSRSTSRVRHFRPATASASPHAAARVEQSERSVAGAWRRVEPHWSERRIRRATGFGGEPHREPADEDGELAVRDGAPPDRATRAGIDPRRSARRSTRSWMSSSTTATSGYLLL